MQEEGQCSTHLCVCPENDGKEGHEDDEVGGREGNALDEDFDVGVEEAEVREDLEPGEKGVEA